ncbi:MAG: GWxTD domain-containing protein [candidate division WOR-3 bacterium]
MKLFLSAVMLFSFLQHNTSFATSIAVDWAVFNYTNGISLIEIYYSCPYNIFNYVVKNDTITATYQLSFAMKNVTTFDSIFETSRHRIIIPSFEYAQSHDVKSVDILRFFVPPGRYWFYLTVNDSLLNISYRDTIEVPDFKQSPVISSIQLASSVIKDTAKGKFNKGNVQIIPNPDLKFGGSYDFIYLYFEGYNLVPDSANYELAYSVLSKENKIVKSFPSELKKKTGTDFAYIYAISTKGLATGDYLFQIVLKDLSTGNQAVQVKPFQIITQRSVTRDTTPTLIDTAKYAQEIKYYATPNELKQYQSLNESGKKEFLRKFWQVHNLSEFISRMNYVNKKYQVGRIAGKDTDRGRIYIKYGPPDEIVMHTMLEQVASHEHWYYYNQNYHFIFVDIYGNNNYKLVYSNNDNEPKMPNWEKYVDPMELDELK